MLTRWLRRSTRAERTAASPLRVPLDAARPGTVDAVHEEPWAAGSDCLSTCPLDTCTRGRGALVVRVDCPAEDACRLRALGVYEGARVNVVDSRNGLLLEVRGSRIALGAAVAASIAVVQLP